MDSQRRLLPLHPAGIYRLRRTIGPLEVVWRTFSILWGKPLHRRNDRASRLVSSVRLGFGWSCVATRLNIWGFLDEEIPKRGWNKDECSIPVKITSPNSYVPREILHSYGQSNRTRNVKWCSFMWIYYWHIRVGKMKTVKQRRRTQPPALQNIVRSYKTFDLTDLNCSRLLWWR